MSVLAAAPACSHCLLLLQVVKGATCRPVHCQHGRLSGPSNDSVAATVPLCLPSCAAAVVPARQADAGPSRDAWCAPDKSPQPTALACLLFCAACSGAGAAGVPGWAVGGGGELQVRNHFWFLGQEPREIAGRPFAAACVATRRSGPLFLRLAPGVAGLDHLWMPTFPN